MYEISAIRGGEDNGGHRTWLREPGTLSSSLSVDVFERENLQLLLSVRAVEMC